MPINDDTRLCNCAGVGCGRELLGECEGTTYLAARFGSDHPPPVAGRLPLAGRLAPYCWDCYARLTGV